MWNMVILFMSLGVAIFSTCNATGSSSIFEDSPGFSIFDQANNHGQKRRFVNLEGARSLIGHSLRVRKSNNGFLNSYGHALRIRSGRQFDNFGHTLRIKRTAGNTNSWKTRGYALRVRRDNEEPIEYPGLGFEYFKESETPLEQENIAFENERERTEYPMDLENEFAPRAAPMKRPGNGVRLHALRIKKSTDFSPELKDSMDSVFSALPKRKASFSHVLRVRKSDDIPSEDLF